MVVDNIYKVHCGGVWHDVRVQMPLWPPSVCESAFQLDMLHHGDFALHEAMCDLGGEAISCVEFCRLVKDLPIDTLFKLWQNMRDGGLSRWLSHSSSWSLIVDMAIQTKALERKLFSKGVLAVVAPDGHRLSGRNPCRELLSKEVQLAVMAPDGHLLSGRNPCRGPG